MAANTVALRDWLRERRGLELADYEALRRRSVDYARGELRWLMRTGNARWIPYTLVYEAAKVAGLVLGINHERLPDWVKPRLSALGNHWRR